MTEQEENYPEKARTIFNLLNQFRQNPKQLAKKLELLRIYLNKSTKVLSEPGKIQIQMMEGDSAIREAINFLKTIAPLKPLEWDDNLAASALEHVNDIGPKGALSYQSSDGTEPEDRIGKYGVFTESLGENIDFGPNDALGVIISLTLDDGEEDRPHRENLFKQEYRKVGIACGPHKTEFQMCVMDFAYDFVGNKTNKSNVTPNDWNNNTNYGYNKRGQMNDNQGNDIKIQMSKNDMMNNSNFLKNNYDEANNLNNNSNPLVKLSLEPEEFGKAKAGKKNYEYDNDNNANVNAGMDRMIPEEGDNNNEFDEILAKTTSAMNNLKIVEKNVEVITKIIYHYDDGTTKEVSRTESSSFKS